LKVLAIDLGGTHATCAMVEDRTVLASEEIPAAGEETLSALLGRVVETFSRLAGKESVSLKDFEGISVGFPGLVSSKTSRVLSTNAKYEDAPGLDLLEWAQQSFGLPLRIENDARMALLGEVYAGAAQGFGDVVMMTLGTGIGNGIILHGKVWHGMTGMAGEAGHVTVYADGPACGCGGLRGGCASGL